MYRLRDYADDEIEVVFYVEELQKVHKSDDIYKIEKDFNREERKR